MVTTADVEIAYRLILGREPDGPDQVARMARNCDSLKKLRNRLMATKEFIKKTGETDDRVLLTQGSLPVEVDVAPEMMDRLLEHVEATWRGFGETAPHWSVLTNERFRPDRLEETRDEFYATGERDVRHFRQAMARAGVPARDLRTCLELGSGVGRVTIWLAAMFQEVVATDISAPHLEAAMAACEERGCPNVRSHRVATRGEIAALPECDAFYSVITLQHSPPPVMAMILHACLARLRPNGIGYFQLPVLLTGYQFAAERFLQEGRHTAKQTAADKGEAQAQGMEHHCLPQADLFRVIERAGCRVLDIQDDSLSRPRKLSNTVLVQKVRPAAPVPALV